MKALQLKCPNCAAQVPAANIHLDNMVAKCDYCSTVFSFAETLGQPAHKKEEVVMPAGFEVLKLNSQLDIEIKWRKTSSNKTFLLIFTIFWNAMLIPFVVIAISQGETFMMLGLSLHLMVGIGFLYYTLAVMLNTTYLNVNSRQLTIEHKPLKVIGRPSRKITATDIRQIYISKYRTGKTNGRPTYAFGVYAVLGGGRHLSLVKGLRHSEQALYVEQEIEAFLEIEDEAVEEEWQG